DATNDDGFLTTSLQELQASLNCDAHPIVMEEIEAVMHRIQRFDPVGCASINLAESLLVQMETLPETEDVELAKNIIRQDIELLGQHNYRQLMKNHQTNESTLARALQIIQSLNPKPGALIHQST